MECIHRIIDTTRVWARGSLLVTSAHCQLFAAQTTELSHPPATVIFLFDILIDFLLTEVQVERVNF